MQELLSFSALPNLHPALVHFPIALLPMALLFDLLGLMTRQQWLERSAAVLLGVATASALAAQWAGEEAADSLAGVPADVESLIGAHNDWAHYAVWALSLYAVARLSLAVWDRDADRTALRTLVLVAGLAPLGLLCYAAELGGALVYRHGVAVGPQIRSEAPPPPTVARTGPATGRLGRLADGTLRWDPLSVDGEALGRLVTPAPGFTGRVTAVESMPAETGLVVRVAGGAVLLLPGTVGDVRVEATLELLGFEGAVGVVHHLRDADTAGLATFSTAGRAVLEDRRSGRREVLGESAVALPEGPFTVAVSSSGRHLEGMLDGQTVAHGNVPPGPAGGCGLLLDGTGSVRVLAVKVKPLGSG